MSGWSFCDSTPYGAMITPFSQADEFPEMSMSHLTQGGCCMAMTMRFFENYHAGQDVSDYFSWLRSSAGIADIMNTQSTYATQAKSGGSMFAALKAVTRMTEDGALTALGYTKVHGPFFPTMIFSDLPAEATKQFPGENRVFKIVYLSNLLKGTAHAMGLIMNYNNNTFMFFDPNEGVAQFGNANYMRQWFQDVYPEYDSDWSGYYMDAWRR